MLSRKSNTIYLFFVFSLQYHFLMSFPKTSSFVSLYKYLALATGFFLLRAKYYIHCIYPINPVSDTGTYISFGDCYTLVCNKKNTCITYIHTYMCVRLLHKRSRYLQRLSISMLGCVFCRALKSDFTKQLLARYHITFCCKYVIVILSVK